MANLSCTQNLYGYPAQEFSRALARANLRLCHDEKPRLSNVRKCEESPCLVCPHLKECAERLASQAEAIAGSIPSTVVIDVLKWHMFHHGVSIRRSQRIPVINRHPCPGDRNATYRQPHARPLRLRIESL